jgi:hypothetical protein
MTLSNETGAEIINYDITGPANRFLTECEDFREGIYMLRKFDNNKLTAEQTLIISLGNTITVSDVLMNDVKTSGLDNKTITEGFRLYPNPAKEYVMVVYDAENIKSKHALLQITDVKGSVVYKQKLTGKENPIKITTGTWPKGVYSVSLMENNKVEGNVKLMMQ